MNTVIEQMLRKYDSKNIYDQKNAIREMGGYEADQEID